MADRRVIPTPRSPRAFPATWINGHLPHADDCWHWDLRILADLSRVRAQVRSRLAADDSPPTAPDSEAAERMLLALDELASNGLRHGRLPVTLRVCPLPAHWLVDVVDAAGETPPRPSPGRPAGQGGHGLFMVAAYATGYGWVAEAGCKHVWALLPRG